MTYNNYVKVYEKQLEEGWLKWGKRDYDSFEQFQRACYEMFRDAEYD